MRWKKRRRLDFLLVKAQWKLRWCPPASRRHSRAVGRGLPRGQRSPKTARSSDDLANDHEGFRCRDARASPPVARQCHDILAGSGVGKRPHFGRIGLQGLQLAVQMRRDIDEPRRSKRLAKCLGRPLGAGYRLESLEAADGRFGKRPAGSHHSLVNVALSSQPSSARKQLNDLRSPLDFWSAIAVLLAVMGWNQYPLKPGRRVLGWRHGRRSATIQDRPRGSPRDGHPPPRPRSQPGGGTLNR